MQLQFHTCDVFTSAAFSGNQLAVVFGAEGLSTETLLDVTREFNYSETVFVFDAEDESHTKRVRIFTPGGEVPFAGHPTIGCAHVLVETGEVKADGDDFTIVLGENVGPVPVRITMSKGVPVHAQLTTARLPEERHDVPSIEVLADVLSLDPSDFIGGTHSPAGVSCGLPFLLVPLRSIDAVKRARVRTEPWERHLKGAWASEPMVFAQAPNEIDDTLPVHVRTCDIRARVFVPGLSVPEDPATGSANACLAGYLAARQPRDGTVRWTVAQGVEMGRASRLAIEADRENGAVTAVRVGGSTVLVSSGVMKVSARQS